jgi:hypothetical protein
MHSKNCGWSSTDTKNSKEAAADAMLQRLYRDVDEVSDTANKSAVGADRQDPELARMSELRTVFANMRSATDVEPPAKGMELLLAAAAKQAKVLRAAAPLQALEQGKVDRPKAAVGIWGYVRHACSRPAVMAAAAAVVVVGAIGTLYITNQAVVSDGVSLPAGQQRDKSDRVLESSADSAAIPSVAGPSGGAAIADTTLEEGRASMDSAIPVPQIAENTAAPKAQKGSAKSVSVKPSSNAPISKKPARAVNDDKSSNDVRAESAAGLPGNQGGSMPAAPIDASSRQPNTADLVVQLQREVASGNCNAAYTIARRIKLGDAAAYAKITKSKMLASCDSKSPGKKSRQQDTK